MNYDNIIFDFDGVIAESNEVKTNAFYELYQRYGAEIAKKVVNHHMMNEGLSRFEKFKHYHKNFLNKNISNSELKSMSIEFSNFVVKKVIDSN